MLHTPRKNGRPVGKRWDDATPYSMRYVPYELGGDSRVIWVVDKGWKWVYLSTSQIWEGGGNTKIRIHKNKWLNHIKKLSTPNIIKRHGGKPLYYKIGDDE
jgi:hypothetical protein